ncbi:family 16 glycosylhydrolase [Shewanella sp.]|uniref:family 16 glycosylhydrolase n=1 Tax=Shewanella sp. TaxID=50422 RepID=UPI00404825FC
MSQINNKYSFLLCLTTLVLLPGCQSDNDANMVEPDTSVSDNTDSDWKLVWQDEFDGNAVDSNKWSFAVDCYGGGNNEAQCYTARPENASVADGMLTITAIKETYSGPAVNDSDPSYDINDTSKTLDYTSARLVSKNKGDWKYGRFEIRAKLPQGQGTWPAIWMLPTDWVYGPWAGSGEIDIMEAVNLKVEVDGEPPVSAIHGTLHYGKQWPNNVYTGQEYTLPDGANPADDFHVYAVEWQEDEIRWYVDDVHFATQQSSGWYSQYVDDEGQLVNAPDDAPFNQRFHMLLNLAVGGAWAANVHNTGIDPSVFPQSMVVDYVRVYECAKSPSTGAGCETIDENVTVTQGQTPPDIVIPDTSFGQQSPLNLFSVGDQDALADGLIFNSYNPDNAISYQVVTDDTLGNVLQITKTGDTGNLYFEYTPRADLSHWQALGALVFDIKVLSIADGTEVLVKADSGWPNVGDATIELPTTLDQWQQVSVPLATLVANGNRFSPGSTVNFADIVNPFVIEPTGPIALQIDNVRYQYQLDNHTQLSVYDDATNAPFAYGQYVASGELIEEQIDVGGEHNMVTQLSFNTNEAVGYFQSPTVFDLSDFTTLSFDLYVVSDPRASRSLNIKMDCQHPCSSGDFAINAPEIGVWTHYDISLTDLQNNTGSSLDLTKVDTPLVIFPNWGDQQGVVLQVDNITITKAL